MRKIAVILFLFSLPALAQIPGYSVPNSGIGLQVCIGPGSNTVTGFVISYAGSCLTMTTSATNYGYVDGGTGNVLVNTTGVPSGGCPIFQAVTNQFAVTSVVDKRPSFCSGSGVGTVITTGSPVANQLAVISGATSITGYTGATTDSSGNVTFNSVTTNGTGKGSFMALGATTTSPSLAISSFHLIAPNAASITSYGWQVPTAGNGSAGIVHLGAPTNSVSQLTISPIVAADLSSQYFTGSCQSGLGDGLNAIPAGTYLQTFCYNDSGVTRTITGIKCYVDSGSASTLNASGQTLGALLTGAVTCGTASYAAGTQSANVALTSTDYIKFTFVADGTAKQVTFVVTYTQ